MKANIFCSKKENTISRLQEYWPGWSGILLWESSADSVLIRTRMRRIGFSMIRGVTRLILMIVLITTKTLWLLVLRRGLLLLCVIMKNSGEPSQESDRFCMENYTDSFWVSGIVPCSLQQGKHILLLQKREHRETWWLNSIYWISLQKFRLAGASGGLLWEKVQRICISGFDSEEDALVLDFTALRFISDIIPCL